MLSFKLTRDILVVFKVPTKVPCHRSLFQLEEFSVMHMCNLGEVLNFIFVCLLFFLLNFSSLKFRNSRTAQLTYQYEAYSDYFFGSPPVTKNFLN